MPRCNDCNRFVSIEMAEPEMNLDVVKTDEGFEVTGEIRLVKQCCDCGTELAETSMEVSVSVEHACEISKKEDAPYSISSEDAESDERSEGRGRGKKTFYGATFTAEVECLCEGEAMTVEGSVECQASHFEELY